MRRIQIVLAVVLTIEAVAVIYQANGFIERIAITTDGTVLPSPWLYPSIFSVGLALVLAALSCSYLLVLAPATKPVLIGSVIIFIVTTIGLWSLHRAIRSVEGISHGSPGWW